MHVFIASDVYDYGKTLHFPKLFFSKNPFWRVPKFNQFEFGNLIYSSKTVFGFELCVQTRLRKYSAAYQAQERDCQNIANPFLVPPGGTKLWPRNDFFIFAGQKPKLKFEKSSSFFFEKFIFKIQFERNNL